MDSQEHGDRKQGVQSVNLLGEALTADSDRDVVQKVTNRQASQELRGKKVLPPEQTSSSLTSPSDFLPSLSKGGC